MSPHLYWSQFICFAGDCGARNLYLKDDIAYNFTSANYPDNYKNDLDCEWHITAIDAKHILVRFLDFEVESGYDFFLMGNGHTLEENSTAAKLTGSR